MINIKFKITYFQQDAMVFICKYIIQIYLIILILIKLYLKVIKIYFHKIKKLNKFIYNYFY